MPKARPNTAPEKLSEGFSQLSLASTSAPAIMSTASPTHKKKVDVSQSRALELIESSPDGKVYEGSRGKPCKLEVNYLKIGASGLLKTAYHYDVEFTPDVPKKMLPIALNTFMREHFAQYQFAFDGRRNFYTNCLLEVNGTVVQDHKKTVKAVMGDRSREFEVKIQFATEVDMSVLRDFSRKEYQRNEKPSQAIQCLDVILRTVFKSLTNSGKAVNVGRALYFQPQGRIDFLGEGMELW